MGDKWYYNNICLNNGSNWNIELPISGLGLPGFKGSDIALPSINGNKWVKKRYDARSLIFPMWVRGNTRDEFISNMEKIKTLLGVPGQHTLRCELSNGKVREGKAEVYKTVSFPARKNYCKFSVEFEMADPFFYDISSKIDIRNITTTEHSWTHNNPGTAPVNHAVITITGPLNNPKIENITEGISLRYTGSILTGETVVINTKDFTCVKGDLNMISVIRHSGDANWFYLTAGDNSMKITSDTTSGTVKIEYYSAYF